VVENGVRETYSARYYNPATGRFLSRDPEDGIATDPKTLHKYLYAGGDPANAIDPSGRADAGETGLTFALLSTAPVPELTAIVGTAASNALLATGITDAIAAIEAAANAGSAEEAVEILINATKLIIKTKPLVRVFLCSPLVFAYGFAEGQLILYAHAHGFNDLEVKGMEYVLDKGKDALKVACGAQLLRYFKK
jgi:RHS repeat-associated protein